MCIEDLAARILQSFKVTSGLYVCIFIDYDFHHKSDIQSINSNLQSKQVQKMLRIIIRCVEHNNIHQFIKYSINSMVGQKGSPFK